jgi:hypothetical protein
VEAVTPQEVLDITTSLLPRLAQRIHSDPWPRLSNALDGACLILNELHKPSDHFSGYDYATRRIRLRPDATLQERFHELAHREHHREAKALSNYVLGLFSNARLACNDSAARKQATSEQVDVMHRNRSRLSRKC